MNNKQISVLMSVYKNEKPEYLDMALRSILDQTQKAEEVILVLDGELTTELYNVVNKFKRFDKIKVYPIDKNVGLGKALNYGLSKCKNELVARMDTDDIAKPNRLERQLKEFINDSELCICSADVLEFDGDIDNVIATKELPTQHDDIVKYSKKRNPFNHPVVMFRKIDIEKVGGYKHFYLFEDYYLWIRLISEGFKTKNIDEPLLFMRANEDMYARRGGLKYAKSIFLFKRELLKMKYLTPFEFVIITTPHIIVALLPNRLRILIYKLFLRKGN